MPDCAPTSSTFLDRNILKLNNYANNCGAVAAQKGPFAQHQRAPNRCPLPERALLVVFFGVFLLSSFFIYDAAFNNTSLLLLVNAVSFGVLAVAASLLMRYSRRDMQAVMEEGVYDAILAGVDIMDSKFFFIADCNGKIVYADAEYRKYFGENHTDSGHLLHFLAKGIAEGKGKELIEEALINGVSSPVAFNVALGGDKRLDAVLMIRYIDVEEVLKYNGNIQKAYAARKKFKGRPRCFIVKAQGYDDIKKAQRQLFDMLPVGVYATAAGEAMPYYNQAFVALFGPGEEAVSLDSIAWEAVNDAVAGNAEASGVIRKKDGKTVQIISHALAVPEDWRGEAYHVVTPVVAAVQEVVRLVEKGNEENMWEFFESSPIAQIILNQDVQIEKTNAPFRALIGRERELDRAYGLFDVISEQNKHEVLELIQQVMSDADEKLADLKPIDVQLLGDKGTTALLYINRLAGEGGKSARLVGHLIDATEQKNLEMRFAHSQKMQAVGQLAGGIAHDFNNLLTAMIGFCDLLLIRHPAGDQSFADLMQIKQNANRAANLVRQLLAFSRKQTLQPEILDITVVLAELSSLVRRLIGENIDLKVNYGQDLLLVKVDQGQLEQVVINLAVNARDAMEGGGTLTIQTSNIVIENKNALSRELISPTEDEIIAPGNYVLIEVIDTGTGMPRKLMGKIFEPFFSTKEIGSGTGLGLSTVYGIVKQTGGYIYVSSKEGHGTKFSIFLKGYGKENAKPEVKEEMVEKPVVTDLTGHGMVLLVEDETPVRIFSVHALTNKGYTVLEASSGEAALRIIEEKGSEINVIITDVIMPGMNGPAMIEEVSEKYPHIKVIFISGYAEDIFIKTYGTERKFNFLPKPFTLKQLASKVKEVMNS